jgi:hypothetical protein
MNLPCAACLAGPIHIDGHPELRVFSLDAAHIAFRCRSCDMSWHRSYSARGRYTWTAESQDRIGLVVPSWRSSVALASVPCPTTYPTRQWLGFARKGLRPRPFPDGPAPAVPALVAPEPALCATERTPSLP